MFHAVLWRLSLAPGLIARVAECILHMVGTLCLFVDMVGRTELNVLLPEGANRAAERSFVFIAISGVILSVSGAINISRALERCGQTFSMLLTSSAWPLFMLR